MHPNRGSRSGVHGPRLARELETTTEVKTGLIHNGFCGMKNQSAAHGDKIWPNFHLNLWTIRAPHIAIRSPCLHGVYTVIGYKALAWDAADSQSALRLQISLLRKVLLVLNAMDPRSALQDFSQSFNFLV
ncbi:hypothetical protein HAX54_048722 [Datura stramonium]|uniref:Uncharacterized protein n=1 Tax=Datura stramonium TaxID=4076 RepID=A0ABS8SU90_DATST|nr:hypothetical protein [Datura stramonium]